MLLSNDEIIFGLYKLNQEIKTYKATFSTAVTPELHLYLTELKNPKNNRKDYILIKTKILLKGENIYFAGKVCAKEKVEGDTKKTATGMYAIFSCEVRHISEISLPESLEKMLTSPDYRTVTCVGMCTVSEMEDYFSGTAKDVVFSSTEKHPLLNPPQGFIIKAAFVSEVKVAAENVAQAGPPEREIYLPVDNPTHTYFSASLDLGLGVVTITPRRKTTNLKKTTTFIPVDEHDLDDNLDLVRASGTNN